MKHLFGLLIISLSLFGCGDDPSGKEWTRLRNFPGGPRTEMFSFSINGKGYAGGGVSVEGPLNTTDYRDLWQYDPKNDQWTRKNDLLLALPIVIEQSFVINNKAYLVTSGTGLLEYDPSKDTWTRKASFPFYRGGQRGFALNGKIFIGCGHNNSEVPELFNDWWEYDPATNAWTQKANTPFGTRFYAASWSSSDKGYYGFGSRGFREPFNDLWEYDPATDKWITKSSEGFDSYTTFSFTINDKPFLGYRGRDAVDVTVLFEYDVLSDGWKNKAIFNPKFNTGITIFSIDETAYLVGGEVPGLCSNEVWKYHY
jgi:N-acetylneuraminic acid mutarotase